MSRPGREPAAGEPAGTARPRCDHFYTGMEDQIGRMVADWIDSVLAGTGGKAADG